MTPYNPKVGFVLVNEAEPRPVEDVPVPEAPKATPKRAPRRKTQENE